MVLIEMGIRSDEFSSSVDQIYYEMCFYSSFPSFSQWQTLFPISNLQGVFNKRILFLLICSSYVQKVFLISLNKKFIKVFSIIFQWGEMHHKFYTFSLQMIAFSYRIWIKVPNMHSMFLSTYEKVFSQKVNVHTSLIFFQIYASYPRDEYPIETWYGLRLNEWEVIVRSNLVRVKKIVRFPRKEIVLHDS